MARQLTLSFRPKSLDDMVGIEKLAEQVRGHFESGRLPQGWMFIGSFGSGKTTIARILATALQCKHSKSYGSPCRDCYRQMNKFDVTEINAGDITGIDGLRAALSASNYEPNPGSRYRVYIIDEAQGLSKAAQTLLLKYLEDCPKTTVWFICTTDPHKISGGIQRRCVIYTVPALELKGVRKLVKKALKFAGSELASDPLVEALNEKEVSSSGLVVMAVEKYIAGKGKDPVGAAEVRADTEIDTYRVCRAVIKADWEAVAKLLKGAAAGDAGAIQVSVAGYLRSILLDEVDITSRSLSVAKAIKELTDLSAREDSLQLSGIAAVLFKLCKVFKEHKR